MKENHILSQISSNFGRNLVLYVQIDIRGQRTDIKTRPEVYSCAHVSTLPLSESVIPEMAKI